MLKSLSNSIMMHFGPKVVPINSPTSQFHSEHSLRHTARRRENLVSFHVPLAGRSVRKVGAGVGDHSTYFLDLGCKLTISEVREENLKYLRRRFPGSDVRHLDMDHSNPLPGGRRDVVYCFGLLGHPAKPEQAQGFISRICTQLLLLETCLSSGTDENLNVTAEEIDNPTHASSGTGCRPTRTWLHTRLRRHFDFVYTPTTQPNHEEFPLDWSLATQRNGVSRAVFVDSRPPLENKLLSTELLMHQTRHA